MHTKVKLQEKCLEKVQHLGRLVKNLLPIQKRNRPRQKIGIEECLLLQFKVKS